MILRKFPQFGHFKCCFAGTVELIDGPPVHQRVRQRCPQTNGDWRDG